MSADVIQTLHDMIRPTEPLRMAFWDIARKDIRLLTRDPRALAALLVFPTIFITVVGLTTGKLLGWRNANLALRIAYYDGMEYGEVATIYDDPERDARERKQARNVVSKIVNALQERGGVEMIPLESEAAARAMAAGDVGGMGKAANAALIIGPEFYERLMAMPVGDILGLESQSPGEQLAALDLRLESAAPNSSTHAVIEQFVWDAVSGQGARYVVCARGGIFTMQFRSRCEELEAELDQPPIERLGLQEDDAEEASDGTGSSVYDEVVPGFTVMFVFFVVNIMARSFVEERTHGTLNRLKLAPIHPVHVLVGKTVPFFALSVAQTVLLLVFGRVLFGMTWGTEPWLMVPLILATSLSATALGLLVATLVRSDAQVAAYATIIVILLAGISGCFLPRDWLADEMRIVSLGTPHGWALVAYDHILSHPDPHGWLVARCCAALLIFTAAFFAVAIRRSGGLKKL